MARMRIFGARKGAGTQLREVQPDKPLQDGPLGSTIWVGVFRSGPVRRAVTVDSGQPLFTRIYGGLTQDSDAPLTAGHFYSKSQGTGTLHVLRVTDGSEVPASLVVYSRDVDRGLVEKMPAAKMPAAVARIDAANGGRWGGRRNVKTGKIGTVSAAITGSVVALGFATKTDAWKGAILRFPVDDAAAEYTVTGNTAAGAVSIAGAFRAQTVAGTNGTFTLELENVHELTGDLEALGVEIADSGETATGFSIYVYRDGDQVKPLENVDLNPAGDRYWYDALLGDQDNWEIAATDSFTGDPADAYQRPANFAEIAIPGGVAANSVTFQTVRWTRSGTGTPYLDTIHDVVWPTDPIGCTITCTFTAATTYTVAATFDDGQVAASLPGGTLGTAWPSPNKFVPGFTLRAGTVAATAGAVVTLRVRPLPPNLAARGALLYVAAGETDGDPRARFRISGNTHDTVTVAPSVNLVGQIVPPGAPTFTGNAPGPHNVISGETVIFTLPGTATITLTGTVTGGAVTTAQLAAEYNALELARVSGIAADKAVEFEVGATGFLTFRALQDFGPNATITLGNGTANSRHGWTNGQIATGTAGSIARLQWPQELGGGYDGVAGIDADDWITAWDVGESPLNDLLGANTGVLRCAMPGVTDPDAQQAMMTWAYETNSLAYTEIPDTVITESGAIAWHKTHLAIGAAQDYAPQVWPSYTLIRSPYGSGLYTCPAIGLIMGLTAKRASDEKGYHRAPAGEEGYEISPIAKDLPTGARALDQELLNAYGIIELRKRGAKIYLFGDRIPGDGGRGWLHKRLTVSHIGRILLTNTGRLVFKTPSEATFADCKRLAIELFTPWWRAGWFDDEDGPAFFDQVEIKVDRANNPKDERELGNLHVDVGTDIVDTAERVIWTLGPKGVRTG